MADFLEGDVQVPGLGRQKKWVIYGVGGLAATYVAYRWYLASRGDQEPAPGASGLYTSDDLSEFGLSTTGGATNVGGNTGSTVTDGTNPNAIDDNAEWTAKAVELLTNQGFDGQVVSLALGEFLARRALDKSEAGIARAALAAAGQPPIGGPFPVIEEATGPGVGTPSTGTLPAPAGLAFKAHTDSSVTMTWAPVDGAMYYRVYRAVGENIGASADGEFTAKGLQPDTEYPFSVAAVGTTGKTGTRSATVKMRTGRIKLGKVTGLKASSVGRTGFRVSWAPVKGAQFYRTYVNGRAMGASDVTYRDFTGLKPNTTHKITVAADVNTQVPGPQSTPLTVKTKK